MLFSIYWIEKVQQERFGYLERVLGTYWDLDMVRALLGPKDKQKVDKHPTELRIPLAMASGADMVKLLKEVFGPAISGPIVGGSPGAFVPAKDEVVEAMPDDKDEFLRLMGMAHQIDEVREHQAKKSEIIEQHHQDKKESKKKEYDERMDRLGANADIIRASKARRKEKAELAAVPPALKPKDPPALPKAPTRKRRNKRSLRPAAEIEEE